MKPVNLSVRQVPGHPGLPQPLSIGVPLPAGAIAATADLVLQDESDQTLLCDFTCLRRWPDGSIKWVQCCFTNPASQSSAVALRLQQRAAQPDDATDDKAIRVSQHDSDTLLEAAEIEVRIDGSGASAFPRVSRGGVALWAADDTQLQLTDINGHLQRFVAKDVRIQSTGRHAVNWTVEGGFAGLATDTIKVLLRFRFTESGILSCRCQIHNSARAKHSDGLWDLGDPGSFLFHDLSLQLAHRNTRSAIRSLNAEPWVTLPADQDSVLYQSSSGGDNWQSDNHIDAQGQTSPGFRGYQLSAGGCCIAEGLRASPVLDLQSDNRAGYLLAPKHFWQNFPSMLTAGVKQCAWSLFPAAAGRHYELQGGERKDQQLYLSFNESNESLNWVEQPVHVSIAADSVSDSGALRYADASYSSPVYEELLRCGLSVEQGFIAKREETDEYGWRNFGDIYADHEAPYVDGAQTIVSHYNNQYDALYGFGRQFLLTGDSRWFLQMEELAKHVLDIDIYRTEQDRAEYNHGLFWHTDHFTPAFTSTHRTFSRHQYADDWQGPRGGGPGPEHCYTSGLAQYHLICGDPDAADAVVGLAEWISAYYEGTGTLLEGLIQLASKDVKTLLSIVRGRQVLRYRYPFNRGIGNYIRALLDSYELREEADFMSRAEQVMQHTFGPADDISVRSLEDIEHTWFYTVFLQEVVRYLDLKRQRGQFDTHYDYARAGLLHYARWMVENEQPSMMVPERLENPSDTWVAQDLRKLELFYAAYRYSHHGREAFIERARYFRDYILETLRHSDDKHFTRIQIILHQNHGPAGLLDHDTDPVDASNDPSVDDSCFYSLGSFSKVFVAQWFSRFKKFSPRREIQWLKTRLT